MYKLLLICCVLFCYGCASGKSVVTRPVDPSTVTFSSSETTLFGDPLTLTGRLKRPAGAGPFPAVVLLHGCAGTQAKRDHAWAKRLNQWGYVTLQVDSLGPRDIKSVCTWSGRDAADMLDRRVRDAYDAKQYLASLPFVDGQRIAVMGWSHGGATVVNLLRVEQPQPFKAAIALYPACRYSLAENTAPLLILIGAKDDWTPAERCTAKMPTEKHRHEVLLQIYPNAYHAYDSPGKPHDVSGAHGSSHHLEHDPIAEQDSIARVQEFLGRHLK